MSDYYFSSSVKRLHQQWGAATARSVDASHRTTYLPFNPQGLPIEIKIHTHRPSFNPHGDRQPKGQNTEPNPPQNVMQNQYNFCSYLSQCHELWEQADLYVSRGQCEGLFFLQLSAICFLTFFPSDFFIQLDQECGPLTLHSSLKDLVYYTRRGLRTLSASTSEEVPPPPFFHAPGPSEQDHKSVMK